MPRAGAPWALTGLLLSAPGCIVPNPEHCANQQNIAPNDFCADRWGQGFVCSDGTCGGEPPRDGCVAPAAFSEDCSYCNARPDALGCGEGGTESSESSESSGAETGDGDAGSTDEGETTASTGDGDGDSTAGDGDGDSTAGDGDGDGDSGDGDGDGDSVCGNEVFEPGEACEEGAGPWSGPCSAECYPMVQCGVNFFQCGDGLDNDQDGLTDNQDPDCLGPCDNNEAGWEPEIPGQNPPPCSADCYFDANTGTGDDDCKWDRRCDPLDPSDQCTYTDGNESFYGETCSSAAASQSAMCLDACAGVTPPGCDCFGCCAVPSGFPDTCSVDEDCTGGLGSCDELGYCVYTVYLASPGAGEGTCSFDSLTDPEKCRPCTQVLSCANTCDNGACELCLGQRLEELPSSCAGNVCDNDASSCQSVADCPIDTSDYACIANCCARLPE